MSMDKEELDALLSYLKSHGDRIIQLKHEMDGMWEHIRNLEEKLLAPQERKAIPLVYRVEAEAQREENRKYNREHYRENPHDSF